MARKSDTPKPAKTRARRRGLRLGLAVRVALIGCGAAIAATTAQLVITPILLRSDFDQGRLVYANSAAEQFALIAGHHVIEGDVAHLDEIAGYMSSPLPGGQAAVVDRAGKIIAGSPGGAATVALLAPEHLNSNSSQVFRTGKTHVGIYPIVVEGRRVGAAVISFAPRTLSQVWWAIMLTNLLVLTLALGVIAPFLLPLARRALSPVTRLEREIKARAPNDKTKLAEGVDDSLLQPLLTAIDEAHARSEAATRRALRMAFADPVTRLPNRLRFMARLEALVDRGGGQGVFLVLCDIDGFRKINLSLGPQSADSVLTEIADRLRAASDQVSGGAFMVGRVGADQFGVIATGSDQGQVKAFLALAERALVDPVSVEGQKLVVALSFGVASAPADAQSAADLMKLADLALKEAKIAGGSRRAFYDVQLQEKARRQSRLEDELREGLERGEFVAVFQPKVKLETGELVGAEALARWRRPDGDVVSPGVFVPLAEELGLISKLGASVLRDACHAAAGWNRAGANARIAVNVSPLQFDDPDFVQTVHQALDDSGLDPRLLELEITESAAVSEPEKVARTMWPLRNRGVRLAIDDFGTGHSNFKSLTVLPFDVFKIDQQFVRALATDSQAPAIVEMILAMAESMGQETVAEGVETREQADFLLRRNCTIGQGYYFSPPLPAAEFDHFLRTWRPRPANRFAA